jgi:asparagine synthase (glutamine-hydrolysing)
MNYIDPKLVHESIEKISHRGPDETGFFDSQNCVLGICRLSIIDVSSGQQPRKNSRISL